MKLITREAALRLTLLFVLLGPLIVWAWFTMIRMPLQSYQGPWLPLTEKETARQEQLKADVEYLGDQIGDRNVIAYSQLNAAAEFIGTRLSEVGYAVKHLGYDVAGKTCNNLEVEIPGQDQAEEVVVVGAHYDSVWGCPGANDNASGVAALLGLARAFHATKPSRTLRFVAFVNEEPPYFQTTNMGSRVYARQCRERGDKIAAMLSLETIGCYTDADRSQKYPFPLGLFYPSRGNFIAFAGNTASRALVVECIRSFRNHTQFPSEGAALPGWLPGVGWSDHWPFWQEGYPGVMITDTAPFRYAHYHTPEDTPDKLVYDRMARVVGGVEKLIQELANP